MEDYEWAKGMNCAVTVCDADGIIVYMNDKSRETYKKHGDLIGKSLRLPFRALAGNHPSHPLPRWQQCLYH